MPPELFAPRDVTLADSPFQRARDLDLAYIEELKTDRLLAPFLREAGLKPKAKPYGNWESSGLDGHIGGHYLSALSRAYATTRKAIYKERLDYFVSELHRAQRAHGDGYVGGIPGSKALWAQIAKGDIRAESFSLNGSWVPWYNLHKTFAGLRDAHQLGESAEALTVLKGLGEWIVTLTSQLAPKQIQEMLVSEHGGMNEALADLHALTDDARFLTLARQFSDERLLQPLLQGKDQLDGLHANTQIPKVIGFAAIADKTDDDAWWRAAESFWRSVTEERSVAMGGNSVREHFHPKTDFSSMIEEVEGPESCNTFNMLALSRRLYQHDGSTDYIEYYERALYNHALSSQHPQTGGMVYFAPMRPQHYRVYSRVHDAMWCCVGTGIENHLGYGALIYAHRNSALYVNLFIPSRLRWESKGVVIRQENRLPDSEETTLVVESPGRFDLYLREPRWLAKPSTITLNGQTITAQAAHGYRGIQRQWQAGDVIQVSLPMATRLEQMPDGSNYYAVVHGPTVLAAPLPNDTGEDLSYFADDTRMGHVPGGAMLPLGNAPMFVSEGGDMLAELERMPGPLLKFRAPDLIGNTTSPLELVPYFRVHESRYMIYWQKVTPKELIAIKQARAAEEKARIALEARTVDYVTPGEQQPEAEHGYRGAQSESGVHRGRHYRHAKGWFRYELRNPDQRATKLRLTFNGEDTDRVFEVLLNGELLAKITLNASAGPVFFDKDYEVPDKARKSEILEVKFVAAKGSVAGGIFGVRLLE